MSKDKELTEEQKEVKRQAQRLALLAEQLAKTIGKVTLIARRHPHLCTTGLSQYPDGTHDVKAIVYERVSIQQVFHKEGYFLCTNGDSYFLRDLYNPS